MSWKKLLESTKESLNDHMRLRNEYLTAENRILRNQIDGRVQLTDSERKELAEIGVQLGKKALAEIATVAQPDTILAWNRKLVNQPTDTSERPKSVGRPRVNQEIEDWVIRMARENRSWGYDRIQGGLNHLGYTISDQTVGNILKRHGILPTPDRKKTVTWREFIRSHWEVLVATGLFTSEVWNWLRLVMSYLLLGFLLGHTQRRVKDTTAFLNAFMISISSRVLYWHIVVGRWRAWIKTRLRECPEGLRDGVRLCDGSELPPHHHRAFLAFGTGQGELGPPLKYSQIRDGPNQQWPVREAA